MEKWFVIMKFIIDMIKKLLPFAFCLLPFFGFCQWVQQLTSGTKTSMRGLSVVDDRVIWTSGSNGMVGRSVDSGKTWKWIQVKGFEKTEFRDIEAFDDAKAIIMGIDSPAYILKTIDGGETWKIVYTNHTKGIFLDAMEFWNEDSGIVLGDPIDKRFFIIRTFNGGNDWQEIPFDKRPVADSGEACFASSGTNIRKLTKDEAIFISGGLRSRLFIRDRRIDLPIVQGRESTGANSVAIWGNHKKTEKIIVVGGDFMKDTIAEKNCFYSTDMGKTWLEPQTRLHGYRSCIEFINKNKIVTCGTKGVDISADGGKNWQLISTTGYHVCRKAKKGKAVFFAGGGGRIGKLIWN
jgi:photosystem II stability/assembly factor-like uncharacterized protein